MLILIFFYKVKGCATIKRKENLEVDDLKKISDIVHAALLEIAKLYDDIKKSTVTGKEIENYKEKAGRLQVLCEAANTGSAQLAPQFTQFSSAIQVCVEKLKVVKDYRLKLVVVMDYCKRISKGM